MSEPVIYHGEFTHRQAATLGGIPLVPTTDIPEAEWVEVRKVATSKAKKMDEPFICYTIDGNLAEGQAGDYLFLDSEGYPYPCAASVFKSSYEEVKSDGKGQGS